MAASKPSPSAGERLRALRKSLGLSTRDVEERSQRVAEERHNQEYHISHAWVTDIENGKFTPSIYKLHQDVRRFDFPTQAEIVGRVTGVAMRIVGEKEPDAGGT
jgi:transcriptional regulator with XRE-family HTH domain